MHALVDDEDPMNSKLVFTQVRDSLHDSYLHAFEIYNRTIHAELAVLSACNTGYGTLRSGEGLMSLARAFAYAGCPSVIMSHWRVDDRSSSQIMGNFYQYLAKGKDKDEALRLAKLAYLKEASPVYRHPFYWNGFVVMGDVTPLSSEEKGVHYWALGVLGILLLVLLTAVHRKKKPVV